MSYKKTRWRPSRHSPRTPPASCSTCSRRPSAGPGSRLSLNSVNDTAHSCATWPTVGFAVWMPTTITAAICSRLSLLCATAEAVSPTTARARSGLGRSSCSGAFAARLASRWQDRLANTHELLELAANDDRPAGASRGDSLLRSGATGGCDSIRGTGGITALAGQMDRLRLHAGGAPSGAPLDGRADRGHARLRRGHRARCLPCSRKAAPNRCSPA